MFVIPTWQSVVSGAEEPHRSDSVVHCDNNDVASVCELLPIIETVS